MVHGQERISPSGPCRLGSSLDGGLFQSARRKLQNLRALADNQTRDEH